MNITRNIILSVSLFFTAVSIHAQGVPNEVESGYTSFSMPSQFGNIPINMTTGAPSLNIPIWTVGSGNLSVPVSASYSANGLRSSDIPSTIGLHWNLIAGGSIRQIVRSKNNMGVPESQTDILNPDNGFLSQINSGNTDAEPDIYRVNAPGLSVDFMLAENHTFIKLIDSDVKIEYINQFWYGGFKITAADGTKYYFDKRKTATFLNKSGESEKLTYAFKWLLSKIENADQTDSIIFNYTDFDDFGDGLTICYGKHFTGTTVTNNVSTTDSVVSFDMQILLKSIVTENEILNFNYFTPANYRSPYSRYKKPELLPFDTKIHLNTVYYNRTEKFLQNIQIRTKDSSLIKSYEFNYLINSFNRVFLSTITEKNSIGILSPPYSFSYTEPDNTGKVFNPEIDFWGFYNPGATGGFIKKLFPVNETPFGILNKAYYPTGGYTEYFYEPNTYCFPADTTSPWYNKRWKNTLFNNGFFYIDNFSNSRAGGYRIKKIETKTDTTVLTKLFDYTNGYFLDPENIKSSGRLTVYPEHEINYTYIYETNNYSETFAVNIKSTNHFGVDQGWVYYEKITVYEDKKTENPDEFKQDFGANGKTEYFYHLPTPRYFIYPDTIFPHGKIFRDTVILPDTFPYDIVVYPLDPTGLLSQKIVYDNNNKKLSEQLSNFTVVSNDSIKRVGLKIINGGNEFYNSAYEINQKNIRLTDTKNKTYSPSGNGDSIRNNVYYSYTVNNTERKYPVKITQFNSKGDTIETVLYYPEDFSGDNNVFDKMIERNILSPTIKKELFKNGKRLSGKQTVFRFHITAANDTLIVPSYTQILEEGNYKTVQWFDRYSDKGQLLESHGLNGIHNCIIYGYNNTMPVATVVNSTYTQINAELSQSDLDILNNPASDTELRTVIAALRQALPDAYILSTTYKPLIGKTSDTDANNNSVFYDYDNFGRLIKVYDQDHKLIKKTEYHIKE